MTTVTVRDLRNRGGEVLDRVEAGESLVVTRSGKPVAELRPLSKRPLTASAVLERFQHLKAVDPDELRADIDSVIDSRLW